MVASSFEALRKFAALSKDGRRPADAAERCELCSIRVPSQHRHLLEMPVRRIVCACDPCALRFQNVLDGRFKLIPRDTKTFSGFKMTDAEWSALSLPIDLAFFFYSTPAGKITAMYPSPAGATESLLPLSAWNTLVANNPALGEMQPDVEALLVNRVNQSRAYFFAPIDKCFELVGVIRMNWKGLSGGEKVWRQIDEFFTALAQ